MVLAVTLSAFGWGAASSAGLPTPEDLAPNTAMRIEGVSKRLGTVTRAEFRHALLLAAAGENRPVPKAGEADYPRLAHLALLGLLEAVWLKGQAAEMGIVVTHAEVVRERELIKEENFERPAEFRRFLHETKFTRRDVYERVELQLLSFRMQARIGRGADSEAEEQRALEEFVAEFNERWRARTVCAPGYVTVRCANGPPPAA